MSQELLQLLFGVSMLLVCGELLLRSSLSLSRMAQLSPFFIAAVVMGFATSLPELSVSLKAAFAGSTEMTLGNVIGSNIANTWLIVGIAASLARIPIEPAQHRLNAFVSVLAHGVILLLLQRPVLGRWEGGMLLMLFAAYFGVMSWGSLQEELPQEEPLPPSGIQAKVFAGSLVIASLTGLLLSADLLVEAGIHLARSWNVSEKVIAISLVAVGTSLPEVAMAAVAVRGPKPALIFSNVLGSNIFNILLILGVTACIHPMTIPQSIRADLNFVVMSSLALALLLQKKQDLSRWVGAVSLAIYAIYIMLIYTY